MKSWRKAGK